MNRDQIQRYIGNQSQIGGTRHYVLTDGWGRNLRAIDINSGSGFNYTIMPDRGMDISLASFRGTNLVYLTCNGETNPAYFEPENIGWLRTFAGGLLTTCGLTYIGGPVNDGNEHLGLHGRYSTIPAKQVSDLSEWIGDDYLIRIKGVVEEGMIFGYKLRMEREITTMLGTNTLKICDRITNFGWQPSPFTILYHMNFGYPLLSEDAELIIDPEKTTPRDTAASKGLNDYMKFIKPQEGFNEEVFFHSMKSNSEGKAKVILRNKKIGLSIVLSFDAARLPFLTEWKMMGPGEYVLGLEPCNVPPESRVTLREQKRLPLLEPGESTINNLEIALTEL
jgi:galactose mutarotase-like enzyme